MKNITPKIMGCSENSAKGSFIAVNVYSCKYFKTLNQQSNFIPQETRKRTKPRLRR